MRDGDPVHRHAFSQDLLACVRLQRLQGLGQFGEQGADSFLANSGSRRTLEPALVRSAALVAVNQPSFCVDWTLTAGQSRFCTTAVGASTNFAADEYSIRTSEGVRNSKRAFPTTMMDAVCGFAQAQRDPAMSPSASHSAARIPFTMLCASSARGRLVPARADGKQVNGPRCRLEP